jgi:hypothetical protein
MQVTRKMVEQMVIFCTKSSKLTKIVVSCVFVHSSQPLL